MWRLCFAILVVPIPAQDLFLSRSKAEEFVKNDPGSDPFRPLQPGEMRLRTANYNVFGRWTSITGHEGQDERLQAIPAAILANPKLGPGIDVITVEEAWCPDDQLVSGRVMCGADKARMIFVDAMAKAGWSYHTHVVDKPGVSVTVKQTNGGALIFSKWPILATSQYVYNSCTGQDCHAAKGAVYVRIEKTDAQTGISQVFNILSSHLQAWSTPAGKTARKGQLEEVRDKFLPSLGIPADGTEVVLFQGDLNTDFVLFPEEVNTAEATLHSELPPIIGEQLFSSDPSTNFLVGKDGAAKLYGCEAAYEKSLNVGKTDSGHVPAPSNSCMNIPTKTASGGPIDPMFLNESGLLNVGPDCRAYCPCCAHEMLDFITYCSSSQYLQPIAGTVEIVPLKSVMPLTYKWGWCVGAGCITNKKEVHDITGNDLSDHYPVVANFIFRPQTKAFPLLDGCKSDADCHLEVSFKSSCYCVGVGCSWKNKLVNGWDAGASHPVNKNCHFRASAVGSCFCRPGDE